MSVAAYCELHIVRDLDLHHRGLVIDKLFDSQYDLIDIFPVYFLASLESLRHVVDELLSHLVAELHTIIVRLNSHGSHVETIGGGRGIGDLDRSEEIELAHNLLALDELELRILVSRLDLGARLEVLEGIFGSQNGGMCNGAAVVSLETGFLSARGALDLENGKATDLDKGWVQIDRLCRILNRIAVCLCLQICLS